MSSTVSLAGNPITVGGSFLQKGRTAPEFKLVGKDPPTPRCPATASNARS